MAVAIIACEGVCGGRQVQDYDLVVKSQEPGPGQGTSVTADLARKLVNTAHLDLGYRDSRGRAMFQCLECEHRRAYGWPSDGVGHYI